MKINMFSETPVAFTSGLFLKRMYKRSVTVKTMRTGRYIKEKVMYAIRDDCKGKSNGIGCKVTELKPYFML